MPFQKLDLYQERKGTMIVYVCQMGKTLPKKYVQSEAHDQCTHGRERGPRVGIRLEMTEHFGSIMMTTIILTDLVGMMELIQEFEEV